MPLISIRADCAVVMITGYVELAGKSFFALGMYDRLRYLYSRSAWYTVVVG